MFVGSWCRRYTAHLNAVGAVFHTTASVNAARLSVVGLGVMLLFLSLWDLFFTLRIGYILPVLRRDVGILLPMLLVLAPPFSLRLG